jgi:DNA repair protein RadC
MAMTATIGVLEQVLGYAVPKRSAAKHAKALVDRFGGMDRIVEADESALAVIASQAAAAMIKLIPSLIRAYYSDKAAERATLSNTGEASEFCVGLFAGEANEHFYVISLDSQNRMIAADRVASGVVNEALVYPRCVVAAALSRNAAKVIFSHNHPGGGSQASKADIEITGKLKSALETVSITVADHIIVACDKGMSMAEQGLI